MAEATTDNVTTELANLRDALVEQAQRAQVCAATYDDEGQDKTPLGVLLSRYAAALDLIDEAKAVEKQTNALRDMLRREFLRRAQVEQVDKFEGKCPDGRKLSVSIREKPVVKVDPERWNDALRWFAEHDLDSLVQRRVTASKLQELFDQGEALPDGVTLETIPDVAHRRTS
jgi:hypothetical protein